MSKHEDLIGAIPCRLVKAGGLVWVITMRPDQGLMVAVGRANAAEFRALPPDRWAAGLDVTAAFNEPPGLAPAKCSQVVDEHGRTRIGAVPVQARFVGIIAGLHPGCTWMAPARAVDGPVRALRKGRIVALVMGQADSVEDRVEAVRKGYLREEARP